jgi:hypothetical protein
MDVRYLSYEEKREGELVNGNWSKTEFRPGVFGTRFTLYHVRVHFLTCLFRARNITVISFSPQICLNPIYLILLKSTLDSIKIIPRGI